MSHPAWRYGRVITLIREDVSSLDDYGNDVRTRTTTDIPGCTWWPAGISTEVTEQAETVITGLDALMPPGTVVRPTDTVIVAGLEYQVSGEPRDWTLNPFTGSMAGTQVRLKRVTG